MKYILLLDWSPCTCNFFFPFFRKEITSFQLKETRGSSSSKTECSYTLEKNTRLPRHALQKNSSTITDSELIVRCPGFSVTSLFFSLQILQPWNSQHYQTITKIFYRVLYICSFSQYVWALFNNCGRQV